MKIKSQKDFWSGLMFSVVGVAFAWGATNYTIGESSRMGPGYFPRVLAGILMAFGLFVLIRGLISKEKVRGVWGWNGMYSRKAV